MGERTTGSPIEEYGILRFRNFPVQRRAVCWSQMAGTRQHNKSLVSGARGAFRLCSDKWLVDWERTQCQADTMPLSCLSQALQVL